MNTLVLLSFITNTSDSGQFAWVGLTRAFGEGRAYKHIMDILNNAYWVWSISVKIITEQLNRIVKSPRLYLMPALPNYCIGDELYVY